MDYRKMLSLAAALVLTCTSAYSACAEEATPTDLSPVVSEEVQTPEVVEAAPLFDGSVRIELRGDQVAVGDTVKLYVIVSGDVDAGRIVWQRMKAQDKALDRWSEVARGERYSYMLTEENRGDSYRVVIDQVTSKTFALKDSQIVTAEPAVIEEVTEEPEAAEEVTEEPEAIEEVTEEPEAIEEVTEEPEAVEEVNEEPEVIEEVTEEPEVIEEVNEEPEVIEEATEEPEVAEEVTEEPEAIEEMTEETEAAEEVTEEPEVIEEVTEEPEAIEDVTEEPEAVEEVTEETEAIEEVAEEPEVIEEVTEEPEVIDEVTEEPEVIEEVAEEAEVDEEVAEEPETVEDEAEEQPLDLRVSVSSNLAGLTEVPDGTVMVLTATLSEDFAKLASYSLQWQCSVDGAEWTDLEGEQGECFSTVLHSDNNCYWRLSVSFPED